MSTAPPDRTPPESFLLLRYGKNDYTRDGNPGEFEFTPEDADKILGEFADRARDLVIDYEHQTLSAGKAPAAGWINRLEKTAEGLTAHVKYWTEDAIQHLKSGEYRYYRLLR